MIGVVLDHHAFTENTMPAYDANGTALEYQKDGHIVRWTSNGRVPFDDVLKALHKAGKIEWLDVVMSRDARDMETAAFLADYRASYRGPSDEEKAEARAAHGAGVMMTNVVTGHKWRT